MFGGRKKKPENPPPSATSEGLMASRLQELCAGDEELYRVLSHLMFLDPKKIISPLETILNETQEFETKSNTLRAEVGYRIAGGISLYRGDSDAVRKYFQKAASFAKESRTEYQTIAKRAEDAVNVARKYYVNLEPTPKV